MGSNKKKNNTKTDIALIVMAILVTAGFLMFAQLNKPYAITIDNKEVVLVKDKAAAEQTVKALVKDFTAKGGEIKSIVTDGVIDTNIKKLWEDTDREDVLTVNEAVESIKKDVAANEELLSMTVVAKTETKEKFDPEVKYEQDEEMFVGDSRVEEGGEQGTKLVTREITSVNGEITEEEVKKETVLDEGQPTVIYKGVKGLPEGEDWKTYEGSPIFDNGTDLVEYGKKFLGNPYVKGGVSLTNGCDCVGFVRAMYKFYGVNLPATLGKVGKRVPVSDLKPGDIVCYKHQHVALYLGDGKIIHAANPRKDICIGNLGGNIKQIRRVIY